MDRFDRIFDLHKLLSASRHPVSRQRIEQELECSRATAKRIIEAMRLYLNAPIKYHRQLNGYYYDRQEGEMFELPGVWFNSTELHALLAVQQLLSQVQPGLLERQLAPLQSRIESLLATEPSGGGNLSQKIRILQAAARPVGHHFQLIAGSLAQNQALEICYQSRGNNQTSTRVVSPQRLCFYRDNWYLDAYCHLRESLRTFSVDAITKAGRSEKPFKSVNSKTLDDYYGSAYGIFSGPVTATAELVFSAEKARWVAKELWHPEQESSWLDDGRYLLKVPYNQSHELVMDILKHGNGVEVIGPASLKKQIKEQLTKALSQYR